MSAVTDKKKDDKPMKNPFEWFFHAALFVLGAVIALNIAIAYMRTIMPWLAGGLVVGATTWLVVVIARWRRQRW